MRFETHLALVETVEGDRMAPPGSWNSFAQRFRLQRRSREFCTKVAARTATTTPCYKDNRELDVPPNTYEDPFCQETDYP